MKREFIASGEGMVSMLDFCCKSGLTCDNSILEHDGDKWSIRYVLNEDGEPLKLEEWEE